MRSQLIKLSIINPSTPTEQVDFSVVQEGTGEASRQAIVIEPADGAEIEFEDSQIAVGSKVYNLTVSVLRESAVISQLETWAENQTELEFAGLGIGGQILQMGGKILFNSEYDNYHTFRIESPREAIGGYDPVTGKHTADMCYSRNGLSRYKWTEGATTNVPAGWTLTGGASTWDDVNKDALLSAGGTDEELYRDIWYPMGGQITYIVTSKSFSVANGASIGIEQYDNTGSLVQNTDAFIDTTGRVSTTVTLDPDTVRLRIKVSASSGEDFEFADPTVSVNKTEPFSEFNT